MLLMVKVKKMCVLLGILLTFPLLLQVSLYGIVNLLDVKLRGTYVFKNLLPYWNKSCSLNVSVPPLTRSEKLPTIYVITPTYYRLVQKAELTRMSNTLLHIANLHWIVVEDAERQSSWLHRFLNHTGLNYTHLNVHIKEKLTSKGSGQRNVALKWLRDKFSVNDNHNGVVYFADDDNTYSLELFDEMRQTKKVSVWPVAFVGGVRYEACKVDKSGKVSGWDVKYAPSRAFAIDMAGFAVNLQLILTKSDVYFRLHSIPPGYQETKFLQDLVTLSDLEPKADNCTKVLVWHTRTSSPSVPGGYGKSSIET